MAGTNSKIVGCGFHHVFMKVRDLDASIKFYTEALGFVKKASWGEAPNTMVLLDTGDGNYFELTQGSSEETQEPGLFQHIALRCDDCDAALAAARAAGVEVTMECTDVNLTGTPPLNLRIAFFKGPDGEVIELFQNDQT